MTQCMKLLFRAYLYLKHICNLVYRSIFYFYSQDVPVVSPEISGQFDELAAKPNQAKSSVHKTGSKQNGAKYSKKNQ